MPLVTASLCHPSFFSNDDFDKLVFLDPCGAAGAQVTTHTLFSPRLANFSPLLNQQTSIPHLPNLV